MHILSFANQHHYFPPDYVDEGDPIHSCVHCGAIMWYNERINKTKYRRQPIFTLCCMQGQE